MIIDLRFVSESVLLGAGLAMDAFSVSIANGLKESGMSKKKVFGIAGMFAFFQALMPLIGWICIHTIVEKFSAFEKFIPWIALLLLSFIGGKMLIEAVKKNKHPEDAEETKTGFWALVVQGIATSIDALSVGFMIATYDLLSAVICALIIAVITFALCVIGVVCGKKFGARLTNKAEIFGGIILIAIGIEIFLSGILG